VAASSQAETVRKGLAFGGLGFGVLGALAPKVFAGVYGIKGDGNLHTMIRLWGTSTIALSVLNLKVRDADTLRDLMILTTALNAADAAFVATAGSEVDAKTRVMGASTSAAFAAAGGYLIATT
jgi:hypothetical protein